VDRVDEMQRILDALKVASTGEGQLLLLRGEAGSGKTRLLEEAATEAEKQRFTIGFGTALAESVVPYHAWKEVLENLGLETILDEAPPPKLLGLYLIASDGSISIKVEREGMDAELASLVDMIAESVRKSESRQENAEEETISDDRYRSIVERRPSSSLGAIVEGQEDEAFLVDLKGLADAVESVSGDTQRKGVDDDMEAHLRELLESEKYEGIDYTKDDPKLRQARLFEHVTLGLSRKARVHSLSVMIDDIQWADPSSLALLHYVSRNIRESGILLLGTYRVEEADARPHLRDALKAMKQDGLLAEMDLMGLSRKDLGDLAESFLGPHDLHGDFLDLLWQETEGNPLFVREVLHRLEDDEAIAVQGAAKRLVRPLDQLALPERVREVIRARLDRLPKGDRRLLDAAATCGTRFTSALVAKVAGEAEDKVLNGLNSIAQVHGLLRPTSSGFAFDHPTVQEVLYNAVPTETCHNYHKEAAEWLELAGGPIEDVAEHYYRARDSRAVTKLQEAAAIARARYANDEAARILEEALELALPEEHGELFRDLANALREAGRYEASLESYNHALDLVEERSEVAEIYGRIGRVYDLKGEYEDAIAQCLQGLTLVQGEGCREESRILNVLGIVHWRKDDYDKALEYCQRSLEVSESLGDLRDYANSLNNIGNVYADRGDHERALECYERRLAIAKEIGDENGVAFGINNIGTVYRDRGDYSNALERFEESLEMRERMVDWFNAAYTSVNCGEMHWRHGEYEKALEYCMKALDMSEKIGNRSSVQGALNIIGNIRCECMEYEEALDAYRRSLELTEQTGHRWSQASVLNNIATLYRERGEYENALEHYEKSLSISEELGEGVLLAELHCGIGEVHLAEGDSEEALRFCNKALSLSTEIGQKQYIAASHRLFGKIFQKDGLWGESIESFENSIRIYSEIGEQFEEAFTYSEFGLMWKDKNEITRAKECQAKAAKLYEELGLSRRAAVARAALDTGY
jgi:tetratricopeptide (TPR) repeat protein